MKKKSNSEPQERMKFTVTDYKLITQKKVLIIAIQCEFLESKWFRSYQIPANTKQDGDKFRQRIREDFRHDIELRKNLTEIPHKDEIFELDFPAN